VLAELVERISARDVSVVRHDKALKNNLYEFDQVTIQPPESAVYFNIRPKAHCQRGVGYLRSRVMTLELVERQASSVVVPRPSLGPRVYGETEFGRLEVTAERAQAPLRFDWPFEVDLVYTWVDSDDPVWQQLRAQLSGDDIPESAPAAAINASRWHSRDELKYSLRSAWMYAPFVRKIFIVTNGQVPTWLLQAAPNVEVITHDMLYDDPGDLPTFNSNHIETVLHRIPGLAEHFMYLNDDFFFGSPATPNDFFTPSGLCRIFRSARYLDERPVADNDRATVAAHKNTRDAIMAKLGVRPSQKFRHAPYVMRRSVWYEIDELFADELKATRKNKFRSWTDLNGQFLYCHYAMIKGYAIPSSISYKYLEVVDSDVGALFALDDPKCKVFCLNDSNSTEENIDENGALIQEFFDSRFPAAPPWEKGSSLYQNDAYTAAIDQQDTTTLEVEVRSLGVAAAQEKYEGLLDLGTNKTIAQKLLRLLVNQRDVDAALDIMPLTVSGDANLANARLDVLSKCGRSTKDLTSLVPVSDQKRFLKGLGLLGRSVESPDDLERYLEVVDAAPTEWTSGPSGLSKLAAAARRAGKPEAAMGYLERAVVALAEHPPKATSSRKREAERLSDPWVVVDDLLELAESVGIRVFADAGTLLGFVREGDFLAHDYDIDFSTREGDKFAEFYAMVERDWRFDVSRGRTPDKLLQARHVNGTLLDVFCHQPADGGWLKESHVYGWKFDDFDIDEISVGGRTVSIPSPAEKYLEQMYGPDWRVPIPGFDSRLYAPNCYFPDREEIICTVLNKIVAASLRGDDDDVKTNEEFLRDVIGYEVPMGTVREVGA
jgi:hypothetical protein